MEKFIAFDFDGVVVDSVYECFIVTKRICEELGIKIKKNFEKQFINARKFVLSADEYYVISKALEENSETDFENMSQNQFDNLARIFGFSKEFHERFYDVRAEMIKNNKDEWLKLHKIYPHIIEAIKNVKKEYDIFLASARNMASILELLQYFECADIFDKQNIISKELSADKAKQMNYISKNFNIPLNKILFIEDMVQNALSTKSIGVNVAVVAWGYSDQRQRAIIRKSGIPVIENDKIYEQIMGIIDKV